MAVSIDRYDCQQGSGFRGWLWGITRYKLREFLRRRAAQPTGAGGSDALQLLNRIADDMPDEDDNPELSEQILLHHALDLIRSDVEPRTWQAFWRLAIEGHPVAQIGRDLGMTDKAVRQAKYRVMRRLRVELDGQFDWLIAPS